MDLPFAVSFSKWLQWLWAGQGKAKSQKFLLGLPGGYRDTSMWATFCLSRTIGR